MNSLDAIYFGNAFTTRVAQGVIQKEEREREREGRRARVSKDVAKMLTAAECRVGQCY